MRKEISAWNEARNTASKNSVGETRLSHAKKFKFDSYFNENIKLKIQSRVKTYILDHNPSYWEELPGYGSQQCLQWFDFMGTSSKNK